MIINYIKSALQQGKRLVLLTLTLVAVFAFSVATSAATQESENALKQKESQIMATKVNPLSVEEVRMIDEQYKKNLIIEDKIDNMAGAILVKYTKNKALLLKAVSVEKNSKIEAMQAIVKLLESSKKLKAEEKDTLVYFLSKYAPYSNNQVLSQKSRNIAGPQNQSGITASIAVAYSRNSASIYAQQYAYSYNTASYPDLNDIGGDCTNFVSQVMKAGGKAFQDNWYIYKKNSVYARPMSISQLNYSWTLASPSPWISAKEFENYWTSRLANETFTSSYVVSNQSAIFNKPYYRGDVIQILVSRYWWYEAFHAMVVTEYGNSDYLMTYHTSNQKNRPLHDIATTYNSAGYKFKFYSVQ